MKNSKVRIGSSYDVHRLKPGAFLLLGGIKIPFEYTEEAHSDGDVLYHALAEAIIGALALGDLGKFFPPDDANTKNMDSEKIVSFALGKMKEAKYKIGNVDVSIIAERPKLRPWIDQIRTNVAKALDTDIGNVSIKAGTNEGLDEIGKGNAVGAFATVLLFR